MKMKKVLSLALALVFAIGVLAGCGGGKIVTKADVDAFKESDEKLEISWLGYGLPGCQEGTASEKLLESEFNIELKPIFVESSQYQKTKSSRLASGDIPDMIYELDPAHVYKDVEDKMLFEVPYEVIKQYAPSLYAEINSKAKAVWSYSYYDGANYGLPNVNHAHMVTKTAGYRQDWLEEIGKEVPTTVDELHDVLKAFVDNKLGGSVTYGYTPADGHFQHYFGEIFGAYGVLPFDWQEVNGEIVYGGLRPEVETVLGILKSWYSEGIIYPAFAEANAEKTALKLLQADQMGYVSNFVYENASAETSSIKTIQKIDPNAKLVYASQVVGPNGDRGMRGWGYPCHIVSFGAVDAETTPVKIVRLLQMFEKLFTDKDLLMKVRYGEEGKTYEVNYDGTGATAYIGIGDFADSTKRRLAGYDFNTSGQSYWTPFAPDDEFYKSNFTTAYSEHLDKFQDNDAVLTDVFYKVDIVPSATTYIESLRNEQIKLMNNIIMGQSDVAPDQFCEEFEKIWNANGGEEMLKEAKEQQKVNEEIFKKIDAVK